MIKKNTIPTLFGVLILSLGIAVGVFFVGQSQMFKLEATPDTSPKGVKITNITDSSFSISYKTDSETVGFVKWSDSQNLNKIATEDYSQPSYIHHITIRNLNPETTYYFTINSEGQDFDNNNIPWTGTTSPQLGKLNHTNLVSGKITDQSGLPVGRAIIYLSSSGISPLSTTTSQNGEWAIPISNTRNMSLNQLVDIRSSNIELFVEAGGLGLATAQIKAGLANPTPIIILGKIHDFTNSTSATNNTNDQPQASLELPEQTQEVKSRFTIKENKQVLGAKTQSTVTLDSLEDGEIIYTDTPEFFGIGPSGAEITIAIHSELQTDTISVPSSEIWRWSPSENLEQGEHTITISWFDTQGILRQLTRSFTVYAADEPSFESTPSGSNLISQASPAPTATPTPSPSPTPKPTATPTATPIASPSPSAIAQASSSPSISPSPAVTASPSSTANLPEAGTTKPTLIFLFIGTAFLITGSAITLKEYL